MTSTNDDDLWTVVCNDEIFKRDFFACDVYKNRYIVVAGGLKMRTIEREFLRTIEREFLKSAAMYDVEKQSSFALPDLPIASSYRGVVLNDYFYVANTDSDLYRICLSRPMEWEHVSKRNREISNEMHHQNILTAGNHVILIDGQIEISDPTNHMLTSIIEIPHEIRREIVYATVLMKNKIYMIGRNMFIFDIANQSWSPASPHPEPLDFFATVVIDRWIVATCAKFGGGNSRTYVYDTDTQKWTQVNIVIPSKRTFLEYVKLGSHIITLGGQQDYLTAIHIKHIIPDFLWIMLKPYILLRKLIDGNRAAPIIADVNKLKLVDTDMNTDSKANADAVIEKLFANIPLEIFRYILMYL